MSMRDSTKEDCAACEHGCTDNEPCSITENPDEPVEKEKSCENHCPFCDGTDIDYGALYNVADEWYHQRATCLECKKCFFNVLELVYSASIITEEKSCG